jgi:D-alanyl-D-alanine carboxypeptidase (penicillin-binding protein 5/6)
VATSFQKNPDNLFSPASLIKLVTALVMRDYVSDATLDNTVTVTAADAFSPTTAGILTNDVISLRDLAYGLLVPSGNDASLCIGRIVGEIILATEGAPSGTGLTRFITAMNAKLAALSMTGAVAGTTHGATGDTTSKLTPRQVVQLLKLAATDSFLRTVMGTLSRTMTITGVNARTYAVTHTIKPSGTPAFPEFICGKTGTNANGVEYLVSMIYSMPGGGEGASVVMFSPSATQRYTDLRRVMDFELNKP